jgi:hypothetical protein
MRNGTARAEDSQPTGQNPAPAPPPEIRPETLEAAQAACIEWVEKYRNGDITKTYATIQITGIVASVTGISAEAIQGALSTYYRMLDDHALSKEKAAQRGMGTDGNEEEREGARNKTVGEDDTEEPELIRLESRTRSSSPDPKRRKIDESVMPWLINSFIEEATLRSELKLTLKYLREWVSDPKGVRSSIVNSAGCPDFPHSEWGNIIAGKPVNLDQVLSSIYTTISDNRSITKIGELEITSEAAAPASKTVKTHGEWTTAWHKTEIAYQYVMPHRTNELRKYGDHMSQLFSAFAISTHGRLINYDKAVRTLVASRRDVTLGDYNEFQALRIAHLDHHGSGSYQTSGTSPRNAETKTSKSDAAKRRKEVCRRHNLGTCPGSCGRLHACNICKDTSHIETNCPKTSAKN